MAVHRGSASWVMPLLFAAFTALLCVCAWCLSGAWATKDATPPSADVEVVGDTQEPKDDPPSAPWQVVVIDAGHGGEDCGAISANGLYEKDVNLAVALALRDLLEVNGIPTVMTRTEDKLLYDRNVDYQGRKKVLDMAARLNIVTETADCLFVSIHMNAFPQAKYSGMQVWYGEQNPLSAAIAKNIQDTARVWQPNNNRKIKPSAGNIFLLDCPSCPAVLVEGGFLSNPTEAAALADPAYQQELAFIIFTSIMESRKE